jgi:cell division inhibitor SulA
MQFPIQLSSNTPVAAQISLFEAFLARPLPVFEQAPLAESQLFSELSLRGASGHCLHLLAPVLRELSQSQDQRWLTLIAPPASLTQRWLRDAGMDRERILVLQPRGSQSALELCCEALRLGCSHTVVSWLPLDNAGRDRLERAAAEGKSQSLNILLG